MQSSPPVASGKRRAKFVVGVVGLAAAVLVLIAWGLARPGGTSFYMTIAELRNEGATVATGSVRVTGNVVPGSIERAGLDTSFEITDGTSTLPISTSQPLPDAFRNGSEVVARGAFDGRAFTAAEVLAKCPSKFKAKD